MTRVTGISDVFLIHLRFKYNIIVFIMLHTIRHLRGEDHAAYRERDKDRKKEKRNPIKSMKLERYKTPQTGNYLIVLFTLLLQKTMTKQTERQKVKQKQSKAKQ